MDIPVQRFLFDNRASAVLYRFLVNRLVKKTVILPVNICTVVPAIIRKSGYDIEYVDIAAGDLCPDVEKIMRMIEGNVAAYSAVLYNYTYGIDAEPASFFKKLKENYPDILLIEDRCSNMPGAEHAEYVDLTLYSTGYAKMVDLGFGGMGILNDPLAEASQTPYSFDMEVDNRMLKIDINSFVLPPGEYFRRIEERKLVIVPHKEKLNAIYSKQLPKEIQLGKRFNSWRFHILVNNKDVILKKIFSGGLFASSHFMPLAENLKDFPVAVDLQNKVINIFNDFYFNEEKAVAICKIICDNL